MTWQTTNTAKGDNKLYSDAKGVVPSLDLRFASQKNLNDYMTGTPLVDHQRSMSGSNLSPGTFVNSSGLIETATTNLFFRSEEFDNGWQLAGVSVTANVTTAPDGSTTADKIVASATNGAHSIYRTFVVDSGSHTLSVWAKVGEYNFIGLEETSGGNSVTSFDLLNGTVGVVAAVHTASITAFPDGWYRCSITFTTTASSTSFAFRILDTVNRDAGKWLGDGTSGIYIWGAQLEEGATATTYIPTTNLPSAAPRFDHNPTTGESLGLLIEESRTNLFPYSQEFSLANWGFTGAVPSLNVLNAPDGTLTADKITENLTTGTHQTFKAVAVSNTPHSFSVFAKASGRTQIRMVLFDGASSKTAFFDLLTGATSGELFATALTEELPNGWWRCVLTFTPVATSSALALIRLVDENGSDQYTGDNTSGVLLWGAQLETGAFPTSYIPTTGTALTRSIDSAKITGTNFTNFYNNNAGTFYVQGGPAYAATGDQRLFNVTGSPLFNNRASIYYNSLDQTAYRVVNNGIAVNILTFGSPSPLDSKHAASYDRSGKSYSRNGATALTAISTVTFTANALQVGSYDSGFGSLFGHISRLTYFPERLPDATLQAITA
jgi:hypothetical protein